MANAFSDMVTVNNAATFLNTVDQEVIMTIIITIKRKPRPAMKSGV
ncbi:unnamed protein product [marine sediment metagenome]|uniref:Uncharacterized protein n=1 Tax=marine sediment metagenome TaxID=412755 RepID=X1JV02_9ZZZZ